MNHNVIIVAINDEDLIPNVYFKRSMFYSKKIKSINEYNRYLNSSSCIAELKNGNIVTSDGEPIASKIETSLFLRQPVQIFRFSSLITPPYTFIGLMEFFKLPGYTILGSVRENDFS